MYTHSKRDMLNMLAFDIEIVRMIEQRRIAVRGGYDSYAKFTCRNGLSVNFKRVG